MPSFDEIVDAEAEKYTQHFCTNQASYAHITLGWHIPSQLIGATAKNFKTLFREAGATRLRTYATASLVPADRMLLVVEFYERVRTAAQPHGIELPALEKRVNKQLDYRAKLLKEEMGKPGPGWELDK